jgi:hypothetical protein
LPINCGKLFIICFTLFDRYSFVLQVDSHTAGRQLPHHIGRRQTKVSQRRSAAF